MARTHSRPRLSCPRQTDPAVMREFEKMIRKYYPKKSRFFYNGSHYQPNCADNFQNPNSLVSLRYKREFFRSFYVDFDEEDEEEETRARQPSHIPHNLRRLTIYTGLPIVLKKLIKQNKRLEHISFSLKDELKSDYERNEEIVKYLKYSRGLRSIKFQSYVPLCSEKNYRRVTNTWGKTIEKISLTWSNPEANAVMENILRLPKLKEFKLGMFSKSFPYDKLQESNIPYTISIHYGKDASLKSLMQNQPQFKPSDYVEVVKTHSLGSRMSDKMCLERYKIKKSSKQKHSLLPGIGRNRRSPLYLEPVFQNISSLDLTISGDGWDGSDIGQLNNLRNLSINIFSDDSNDDDDDDDLEGKEDKIGEFLKYLSKNVAPYKKLETFLIKTGVWGQKKPNENPALCFFEACSETLRKVHFEFEYYIAESEDAEWFYEGLSKLKNLQSLSLCLDFGAIKAHKIVEGLCQKISELKSLEELDFRIRNNCHQRKALNLKFPTQLKKLSLGMDISGTPYDSSKAICLLSNLLYFELEFTEFITQKCSSILHDMTKELTKLQVLVLKQTEEFETIHEILLIKERLDELMKESLNLNLTVFANIQSEEMMIYRRKGYPWSQINPIVDDISFGKNMKIRSIKSYQ